jgi:hypothetical protein
VVPGAPTIESSSLDLIRLGDSLPFTAPNDPKGGPRSDFGTRVLVAASIYQEEFAISSTLNPANSHPPTIYYHSMDKT